MHELSYLKVEVLEKEFSFLLDFIFRNEKLVALSRELASGSSDYGRFFLVVNSIPMASKWMFFIQ